MSHATVLPVLDGSMRLPAYWTMPVPGEPGFAQHCDYLSTDRMISYAVGGFLVVAGDRRILVDAGMGPSRGPYGLASPADPTAYDALHQFWRDSFYPEAEIPRAMAANLARCDLSSGALPASLAALGFSPNDITDVVLTHLHFDHVGWASVDGAAYFDNATYWIPQADLDHFLGSTDGHENFFGLFGARPLRDVIGPVLPQTQTFSDNVTLAADVTLSVVGGHTPGSAFVTVQRERDRVVVVGDAIHCPLEITTPHFTNPFDVDTQRAREVRRELRALALHPDVLIAAPHFPGMRLARFERIGDRTVWLPEPGC